MDNENAKAEGLVETEALFKEFAANRCEETYRALVEGFVFETMATQRTASFPLPEIAFEEPANGGTLKFGFAVVRNDAGNPFAVLLTSHEYELRKLSVRRGHCRLGGARRSVHEGDGHRRNCFESMGRRRRVHTEVAVPGDGREAVGRDADERRVGRRIKWLLR